MIQLTEGHCTQDMAVQSALMTLLSCQGGWARKCLHSLMFSLWGKTRTTNSDGAASQVGPFPRSVAMYI